MSKRKVDFYQFIIEDAVPKSWIVGDHRTPTCPTCEEIYGVRYALMWDGRKCDSEWHCCSCNASYLRFNNMLIAKGGDNMGHSNKIWGKFYMVMGRNSSGSSFRHESLEDAKEEAERLCRREEQEFAILEVIEVCKPKQAPVEWSKPKEK